MIQINDKPASVGNSKNCQICGAKKAITLPYGPHNFCQEHFIFFFERRVKRTIKKYEMISNSDVVGIGVSGGK
ncbi:MAG: hypothetical protein Q7K42_00945, partial [Candidatus Diapherotrites archaeon]|nr:hypothetical protein [Candidatus Diapherotrites archaeon]